MARHRDFRNMDYDDLSGDDEDEFGSLGASYGSLDGFYAPPSLSYDAFIPDTPSNEDRYEGNEIPEDHEILSPALSEIEQILFDSFSTNQLISALRENNYNVQQAIDWLMEAPDEEEDQFQWDGDDYDDYGERGSVHAGASLFAKKQTESEEESHSLPSVVSKSEKEQEPVPTPVSDHIVMETSKKEALEDKLYSPSSLAGVLCHTPPEHPNLLFRFFPSLQKSANIPPPFPSEFPSDVTPFLFDEPSPDDYVLHRQSTSQSHAKSNNTPKTASKRAEPFTPIVVGTKKKQNKNNKAKKQQNTKKEPVVVVKEPIEPAKESKANEPENTKEKANAVESAGVFKTDSPKVIIPKPKKSVKQMTASSRSKITKSIAARKEKPHMSLVCVGHVDAGKSTTMGRLLLELGLVDQRVMHKFRKLAAEEGKSSFVYAWILDEHVAERSRGVTIDVGLNYFETNSKRITLLDAPGHKEFVPNMITGAAQADAAILFVDATVGEFETGLTDDGQTKEHTLLLRSLGVDKLIVAVNKLDMTEYSQERYNFIVEELRKFLKQAGYKQRGIRFIPCSGFHGENLVKRSTEELCCWYSGDTLLEAIDHLELPSRLVDAPFRMCVTDVFKNITLGLAVSGKVQSGIVGSGDQLLIIPGYEICSVKTLEVQDKTTQYASAGDSISLGINGIDIANIGIGYFLCDPQKPIPYTNRFMAKIITFKVKYPITNGSSVTMQYQNVTVEATVIRLLETLDKTSGAVTRKRPRSIGDSTAALIAIRTEQPICIENFSQSKELGRFTLRDDGHTVATGIVTKLLLRKP